MKELLAAIGKTGTIELNGLSVSVTILDVKRSYGHTRFLVTPVAGEGQAWTEAVSY